MQISLERNTNAPIETTGSPLEAKIWRETEVNVNNRISQAYAILRDEGLERSADNLTGLAFSLEVAELADKEAIGNWTTSQLSAHQIALLHLEVPAMAQAQHMLEAAELADAPREKRIANKKTMIQFNHDLAEVMTFLPPAMLAEFPKQFFAKADRMQQNLFPQMAISERRFFDAVGGVRREVAFARALHETLPDDWEVRQASVEEDLHGSDLIVTDGSAGELHIDTKSATSFEKALSELVRRGEMTSHEYDQALVDGYKNKNGYFNNQRTDSDYYIVNADQLGKIENFEYNGADTVYKLVDELMTKKRDRFE